MGMANYYLKARFSSARAARTARRRFEKFLDQARQAEEWWQADQQRKPTPAFWRSLKRKFPLVFESLGTKAGGDNRFLSYVLNFSDPDEPSPHVAGDFLLFAAYVWHFADWDLLADYLRNKLGALGVAWISEESLDPFEVLNP